MAYSATHSTTRLWTTVHIIEHLYSPRMVEEIKEKQLEHQTNKQSYDLTILTILTTVYNSVTITTKEKCLAYTDIEIY